MRSKAYLLFTFFILDVLAVLIASTLVMDRKYSYTCNLDNMCYLSDDGNSFYSNYVDKDYETTNRYLKSEDITLKPGKYNIKIEYQSNWEEFVDESNQGTGIWYEFISDANTDSGYETLNGGDSTDVIEVWVKEKCTGYVKIGISDEVDAYIVVASIKVEYDFIANLLRVCSKLIFILVILEAIMWIILFHKVQFNCFLKVNFKNILLGGMLIFISLIPLFGEGLPFGHDIYFHLTRIDAIAEGLTAGQIPVRIHPLWMENYGYSVGVFYGDLFLYPAALLRCLGYSLEASYKFFLFYINILTLVNTWWAARYYLKNNDKEAVFATVIYYMSIYRMFDMYTRAAVGELIAMAFFPVLIVGISKMYCDEKNAWIILSIGATGLIESHVISCVMAAMLFIMYFIININKTSIRIVKQMLLSIVSIILLNLFFVLPFMDYYSKLNIFGKVNTSSLANYAVPIIRIILPIYNPVGKGVNGNMPTNIGLVCLPILFIAIVVIIRTRDKEIIKNLIWVLALLLLCSSIIPYKLIEEKANAIYNIIMLIQFPWRFLSGANLFMMLLYVSLRKYMASCKFNRVWLLIPYLCIIQTTIFMIQFSSVAERFSPTNTIINNHVSMQEYLLEGTDMEGCANKQILAPEYVASDIVLNMGTTMLLSVNNVSDSNVSIDIPRFWYPGYEATAGNKKLEVTVGDNNRVRIIIPANYNGDITVRFEEPLLWRISEAISLVTFIGFICVAFNKVLKTNKLNLRA